MKFSGRETERGSEVEREGKRDERPLKERKRATNWLQSCELKTQRRTSRAGEEGVGVGRGRVDLRQRVPREQWLVISSP